MKLLILNCGGSSMKYQVLDMPAERVLVKGGIDRLFTSRAEIKHWVEGRELICSPLPNADFTEGIRWLVNALKEDGIIDRVTDIDAIAHKIAHGGEKFRQPVLINEEVLTAITALYTLAPVHLPPAVAGIRVCMQLLPGVPQYAVFETNFHQTLPPYAYIYGLPYEWYEKYGIRKYGFHGTSHRYVAETAARILGKELRDLKLISCHLGSGTSVAAIKYGQSVDISSGLTPQSGTIMSTRPGDFDPWVFPFIMELTGMTAAEVNEIMTKKGGLLGISGVSGDMRDLEAAAREGNQRAQLAIDIFCYQVKKYIGAFAAAMNGLHALIFTGGIGERSPIIRARICHDLEFFGIELDDVKNEYLPRPDIISRDGARITILVIDTNEELMVARQVAELIQLS
ncbi:acetate kinase [Neomoorella humiferrea]|uniref:acetate/propionate family kinase n=1 Tax=Neomoorella humiferrea TaxID=676965 RepID=UPI003D915BE7